MDVILRFAPYIAMVFIAMITFAALKYITQAWRTETKEQNAMLTRIAEIILDFANFQQETVQFQQKALDLISKQNETLSELTSLTDKISKGADELRSMLQGVGDTVADNFKEIQDLRFQLAENLNAFQQLKGDVQDLENKTIH